jgi:hypothetical protein
MITGGAVEFVGPCVDDGMPIDVVDGSHESALEFLLGCDTNVAEYRAGEFGGEAFDKIEP